MSQHSHVPCVRTDEIAPGFYLSAERAPSFREGIARGSRVATLSAARAALARSAAPHECEIVEIVSTSSPR